MTRTRETISRRDWEIVLAGLDGDVQRALQADLASWEAGDCQWISVVCDSTGKVDSESSPRPADAPEYSI